MDTLIAWVESFLRTVYNVPELIRIAGLFGLILIVFAETGLMIGFFLPGDSLLITAGLFAFKGDLNIWTLNIALVLAAIIGDATGYYIGRRTGKALYSRPNSLLFRREHLIKTQPEKFGPVTRQQIEAGFKVPATAYLQALRVQTELKIRFASLFREVDALLSPAVPWVALATPTRSVSGWSGSSSVSLTE